MKTTPASQLILLDRAKQRPALFAPLRPRVVTSLSGVRQSVSMATKDSLWVSYASDLTDALVSSVSEHPHVLGSGLFIHALDIKTIPSLNSAFRRIAFTTDGGFLSADELAEVLQSENRADLFIGGVIHQPTRTITFWRGDLKGLTLPFSTFEKSGVGTEPDFDRFSIIDCGQTVRLGTYEAAVDALLYEHDPRYRRALSQRRLAEDRSFGAALRRLRKQRGLRREDFRPDVSAKSIARIEQGKVKRVQSKTLAALARRLEVPAEEIASY